MPVDPTFGIFHAAAVADIVQHAENRMLELIAEDVRKGILLPETIERIEALTQANATRATLGLEARALQVAMDSFIWAAVREIYDTAHAAAVSDLARYGREFVLPPARAAMIDILATETIDRMDGFTASLLRSANDAYAQAVDALLGDMAMGGVTRTEAAQYVMNRLADKGLTVFKDSAGREWSANAYAEMSLRTGFANVATAAHMQTLTENGVDLVIVSTAPRPCPLCAPWEGKVLSITGATTPGKHTVPSAIDYDATVTVQVEATLDQARENGLHHPNCRHSLSMYQPGVYYDHHPVSDPAEYIAGQDQRRLERGIRKWRNRQAVALYEPAARKAEAKVQQWTRALEEHLEAHPYLKRQSQREQTASAY